MLADAGGWVLEMFLTSESCYKIKTPNVNYMFHPKGPSWPTF